jgi:CDP-glucose 4,6-dehydratase
VRACQSAAWADRAVLVTGCTGMLGAWLVDRLVCEGARVLGLIRGEVADPSLFRILALDERTTMVRGRVEDYAVLEETLREHDVDTVFHLAAQTETAPPRAVFEANVLGTWNLLEAARAAGRGIRVVLTSSVKVYGEGRTEPWHESMPVSGAHPYGASKICAEAIGRWYQHSYGIPVCTIRFSGIYGGGDFNFQRLIPGAILSALRGVAPELRGDASLARREYLYVDDAVDACLAAGKAVDDPKVNGEIFNVSAERTARVLEVVETILRLAGRPALRPLVVGEASEALFPVTTSTKAKQRLGWSSQTSLETGLQQTIDWYRKHIGHLGYPAL